LIAPTQGRVLEICFETDKNLPYYSPWVTEISIVCVAGASADRKVTTTDRGLRVERIFSGLETNALPFEDAHFDWVVTTLALCRIPNPPIILREIRRVLKPSGSYIFIEHGISADRKVNRWQRRMKRVWRRWGGCELDREIDRMIRDAGLEIGSIDRYQLGRPRFLSSIYRGSARRAKDHSLAAAVD
jgi:SAM-dependent methyltransferase